MICTAGAVGTGTGSVLGFGGSTADGGAVGSGAGFGCSNATAFFDDITLMATNGIETTIAPTIAEMNMMRPSDGRLPFIGEDAGTS